MEHQDPSGIAFNPESFQSTTHFFKIYFNVILGILTKILYVFIFPYLCAP